MIWLEAPSMSLPPMEFDPIAFILALIIALGGGIGWTMRRKSEKRKKRKIGELLDEIDNIYARFKMNTRRCEAELYRFKDLIVGELKEGVIDEASYNILDKRIETYMKEIREQIINERLGGFPSKLREGLRRMVEAGDVTKEDFTAISKLLESTTDLTESDKAELRELLEKWKEEYLKEKKMEPATPSHTLEETMCAAALYGDVERVKALLKENPRLVDAQVRLKAIAKEHPRLVDKTRVGDSDWTMLHIAAIEDHTEVVKLLLAKGAEVNAQAKDGYTPLHCAAHYGKTEVVKLLLAKGAGVNARNSEGYTASQLAAQQGHAGVVKLLRRHEKRGRQAHYG